MGFVGVFYAVVIEIYLLPISYLLSLINTLSVNWSLDVAFRTMAHNV